MSFIVSTPAGEMPVRLALPGVHNVANALAAIAVGLACQLPLAQICAALAAVRPVPGRLLSCASPTGATVIDDCYNANPGSVRAAIDLLASCTGRRTLMLGAMKELGSDSDALHAEVGEYAALRVSNSCGVWVKSCSPRSPPLVPGASFCRSRSAVAVPCR